MLKVFRLFEKREYTEFKNILKGYQQNLHYINSFDEWDVNGNATCIGMETSSTNKGIIYLRYMSFDYVKTTEFLEHCVDYKMYELVNFLNNGTLQNNRNKEQVPELHSELLIL